jgi:glutamyl/glutaminyl-tRNA synthetase
MINTFCEKIGVARKGNENLTSFKKLEFYAREELNTTAPRTFAVLDPVLLEITNPEAIAEK